MLIKEDRVDDAAAEDGMDEGVMIDDLCAEFEDADLEPMVLLRSDALGEGAAEIE